jgi:hypothetical protein
VSAVEIAGLVFTPFAAWYIQYVIRWSDGPFGIIDRVRYHVFGVAVETSDDGDFHFPTRKRISAVGLLECSRCTLFWVGLVVFALWWYLPIAIIAFGIMGAASKLDDF